MDPSRNEPHSRPTRVATCGTVLAPHQSSSEQILHLTSGTPSFRVCLADHFRVRHRTYDGTNLGLAVAFDGCLLRTAVFFTPEESDFGADLDIRVDHSE